MRCLQCGKDLPLLKRMAGSEFCSDAHRREYQQEYSDLALGRLLQSKPPGREMNGALPVAPNPLIPTPAANGHAAPAPAITPPPLQKLELAAVAKPVVAATQSAAPVQKEEADPAVAKPARVDKPVAANVPWVIPRTLAFEQARAETPSVPVHQTKLAAAALLEGSSLPLGRGVVMVDVSIHALERELELRESTRPAPRIDMDLRIVGAEALKTQEQALAIPGMRSIVPQETALWTSERRDFTGSLISFGSLASFALSTTGFDEPGIAAPQQTAVEEVAEPMVAAAAVRPPEAKHDEQVIPQQALERLTVSVPGIAAGRAKAAQVFGASLFDGKLVQVPRPSGLPLRPLMVLGMADAKAAPVSSKKTKSDVRILPPAATKPSLPVVTAAPVAVAEPDLGLPELRLQPPKDAGASRMPKIAAAIAGAAAIGLGIFFFVGRSESRPKPAVETSTASVNWISNFASDSKRQRRVSVLRASLGLAAYRLEFESSIQIKGLGWVYRAQDARNYYVSKIELEKPGQNPEFAVVHFAVIDGVEQPHQQAPLQVGVPLGGHYKVRFEAVDDRFTTWVEGQQVDQWTDGRLKTGGAGLYREGAEQFTLHGDFQVTPLAK